MRNVIYIIKIFIMLIFFVYINGCQKKPIRELTIEEQNKLAAMHYKNAFDTFFLNKFVHGKIDEKDRYRNLKKERLKAYKDFRIITERYPESIYMDKALISVARIEEEYISDYEALVHYKKLLEEFPDSKYNFEAKQKVIELKNKFIWKIEEHIYKKEYDNAIEVVERIKKILNEFDDAYYYLGIIYEKRGLYEQAIREWEKLKNNPDAHFLLSIAYYDRKIYEKAIKELLSAIKLDKDNALYYYNLGVIYEQIGNNEKAHQIRNAYLSIAEKQEEEKRWTKAVREFYKK